jgi:hypothetical protein
VTRGVAEARHELGAAVLLQASEKVKCKKPHHWMRASYFRFFISGTQLKSLAQKKTPS